MNRKPHISFLYNKSGKVKHANRSRNFSERITCNYNFEADSLSRYKITSGCFRKIVAGQSVEISAFTVLKTASAFRPSGTTQLICLQFIIAGIVSERACVGTSSKVGNQPSPSCCFRHASSNSTTFTSFGSLKSATGGSLNAMCPFSPIPIQATSTG